MTERTELEKMLAGELYDASDRELAGMRERARDLCRLLNASPEADGDRRRSLFISLFGSGGETVNVQPPFFCDYGVHVFLGRKVFFNFNCVILDVCPVKIGSRSMFGPGVQILTALHPIDAEERATWVEYGSPITIGEDVWVGGGAIICPGVTVGNRSIIGGGAVVTKNVPDDVIVAGNPAKIIRRLKPEISAI